MAVRAIESPTAPVGPWILLAGALATLGLGLSSYGTASAADVAAMPGGNRPFFTWLVCLAVALALIAAGDGKRGVRQVFPVAIVTGAVFGITQWISATYISMELTDIISSLCGLAAIVIMLRFWRPQGRDEARASLQEAHEREMRELGATDPNEAAGTHSGGGRQAHRLRLDPPERGL